MFKIKIAKDRCKGCLLCIDFCPQKLIKSTKRINQQGTNYVEFIDNQNKCIGCRFCAMMCPDTCIEVYKNEEKKSINDR